jgi:tripartite-type tricarboxylate transporter receptor subunit TctC
MRGLKEDAMKLLHRRQFLHLAAGAVVLPAVSRVATAQTYPTRPVRIIVGFAAGGQADILARLTGQWLSERFGQSFVVENRTGGGGNIATEAVVHAPADGYTLLATGTTSAINATLYEKIVNFDFIRDIAPVAGIARDPNIVVVNPSVPARTILEFIAYAKAHPGELNMASAGIGTPSHVAGELFKMMTGVRMLHIPYRGGGPALIDLLGGSVQVMFVALSASIGYVRDNKLRPLAVTTASRSNVLPEIPTVSDSLPGFESSIVGGIGVPRDTPVEIVGKLNKEINAGLADPRMKAQLANMGSTALPGSPAEFGKLIADETEKWGKVIRAANIKAE